MSSSKYGGAGALDYAPEDAYGNQFLGYQEFDEQEQTQSNPMMSYEQHQHDLRYQSNGHHNNRESGEQKASKPSEDYSLYESPEVRKESHRIKTPASHAKKEQTTIFSL